MFSWMFYTVEACHSINDLVIIGPGGPFMFNIIGPPGPLKYVVMHKWSTYAKAYSKWSY